MLQFQVLLTPVIALMSLAFLFSAVLRRFRGSAYEPYAFGTLFGLTVVAGMTSPLSLGEGLIFDTRTLMTGASVAFAGPIAGLVTLAFGVVCRLVIGGAGTFSGVLGLFLAYSLAFAWIHFTRKRVRKNMLGDILLGLAITPSIVALFVLPREVALDLVQSVLPLLLFCNVVGMMAVGFVFRREVRYYMDREILESYARTDPLTHLLNRRGFEKAFRSARFGSQTGHALFYFDIDNFKDINDRYGHDAGDAALAIVAARIKASIREDAVFARHGGDEFSIYIADVVSGDVQAIGTRLCDLIASQPVQHKDQVFDVCISLGAYWSNQPHDLQDMIDRADTQLLRAKRNGKNRAEIACETSGGLSEVA